MLEGLLEVCVRALLALVLAGYAAFAVVSPLRAHHSFAAQYDSDAPVELDGVITRVEWKNPHAHFYVDVENGDGTVANWDMELASPNMLTRNGWRRDALEEGDHVVVTGSQARDGTNTAATTLITLDDGRQYSFITVINATPDR
jgi:hypothetical protein